MKNHTGTWTRCRIAACLLISGATVVTAQWSPPKPDELAVWFDASNTDSLALDANGKVETWNDLSGHERHATQTTAAERGTWLQHAQGSGLHVVAFPSGSGWMVFPEVTTIRTVFWVLGSAGGSGEGGGILLGHTDYSTYRFHRGGSPSSSPQYGRPLWDATWASAEVKNGDTRLNGGAVDGKTSGLSGQYDLVSLVTTGNVPAKTLVNDRGTRGGLQVSEILIYTTVLAESEIFEVEGYLAHKWGLEEKLPEAHPYATVPPGVLLAVKIKQPKEGMTFAAGGTIELEASAGANEGTITRVSFYNGARCLGSQTAPPYQMSWTNVPPGEHTLHAMAWNSHGASATSADVNINVVPWTPLISGDLVAWFDASDADTLTLDGEGGVSQWSDKSGINRHATQATPENRGLLLENEVGDGLHAISFPATLGWMAFTEITTIRSVFWIVGSRIQGSGILLGSDDFPPHFHRGGEHHQTSPSLPIWENTYSHVNVREGITRLNGVTTNGTTVGLSGDYDLVSLVTTGNVKAKQLAKDRELRLGGLELAEVLIYTNPLTPQKTAEIEGYLAHKWGLADQLPEDHPYKAAPLHYVEPVPSATLIQIR